MQNNQNMIQENEIDLKELFLNLWKNKVFIFGFTFVVTLISVLYVSFKSYTPIYQGKLLVEIGQVFNKNNDSELIDYPYNLNEIIKQEVFIDSLVINIPKRTDNLLEIVVKNKNKSIIKKSLNKVYTFIINRHNDKTKYYEKSINTKKVGDIIINNSPINKPKKKLTVTVSFITGFILSIFLVFFIEFIRNFKNKETEN